MIGRRWALTASLALPLSLGRVADARADDVDTGAKVRCASNYEQAQLLARDKKLLAARREALSCLADSCPAVARSECQALVRELEAATPTIVVEASDERGDRIPGVRVTLDGATFSRLGFAEPVDPGAHALRFEAPGRAPVERAVTVAEGAHFQRIAVIVPGPGRPRAEREAGGLPTATWILGAVGLAGLGSFAAFGSASLVRESDLESACRTDPRCPDHRPGDFAALDRERLVADLSLGIGAAALATAGVVAIVDRASRKPAARVGRAPLGSSLSLRF